MSTDRVGQLPAFMPGLELCRVFYEEAVRPIVERRFPALRWGAARNQAGSDVLGFDTPRSTDHGWGPMLTIFVAQDEYSPRLGVEIKGALADELPFEVRGFPTFMGEPDLDTEVLWQHGNMKRVTQRPIKHFVGVGAEYDVFRGWLGVNPLRRQSLRVEDWLCIPTQQLRTFTSGAVYRDDTGEIARARTAMAWYPHDVWLYILAAQWLRIDQEEPFMGRCGEVGDELGSRVVAARLVRELMLLACFMERQYPPYIKWLGTAFSRLECAPRLTPHLIAALQGQTWQGRDGHLAAAYEVVATMSNDLAITEPIDPRPTSFHDRPFTVIHGSRFWKAIQSRVQDASIQQLMRHQHLIVGSVSQWADSTDVHAPIWRRQLRRLYHDALAGPPDE